MYELREIELVHLFSLKKLLNVSRKTPNDMVSGKTGRFPRASCKQ